MSLADLWFVLLIAIVAAYLILDGFDLGVGMLHPFAAKEDAERRIVLNSIGPVWDGNEVWLVVGGGVLFAAFPVVYAALFSGFYWALMLVLLSLILRAVAIEFRGKRERPGWRALWDSVFSVSSFALAMLLGVAFGNLISGVPLKKSGDIEIGNILDLLHPFALWIGLTTIAMLLLHGALYLNLKTEGDLQARVRGWIPRLVVTFALIGGVAAVWIAGAEYGVTDTYKDDVWPIVFPIVALVAFVIMVVMFRRGRDVAAFFSSSAMIAMLLATASAGLYPNLLRSSIEPKFSMTVSNASAASETLTVMLIVAVIGIPFVLLYTAGVQYLFRGKVKLTPSSY
jgi:cytochrome bd ubiquinol oxidase subunit II